MYRYTIGLFCGVDFCERSQKEPNEYARHIEDSSEMIVIYDIDKEMNVILPKSQITYILAEKIH